MVAIKGPMCGTHSELAPYTKGPGDTVLYLPRDKSPFNKEDGKDLRERMNLIPEWWH
jgi:hypothetical protein